MKLIETPPIRRLFVPKDGYILFEGDLKRADPQIVAKESGEESLLQVFRDGLDVYTDMGKWLYEVPKITNEQRQWNKNAINGINYSAQAKTMAATLHTTEEKAKAYIERWRGPSGLYPGIGSWHRRIDTQLRKTHTVRNVYGYRRFYTDRLENLLPKALAWICSSAVSVTIDRGMKHIFGPNVYGDRVAKEDRVDPWSGREYITLPKVELLMQIHDSIIGQFPAEMVDEIMPKIVERMEVEIPYADTPVPGYGKVRYNPLIIPVSLKVGVRGESWGDLPSWSLAA